MQVFLFSLYFPYAEVNETFIAEEMRCIATDASVKITLVPFKRKGEEKRILPEAIDIDAQIVERTERFSVGVIFSLFFRGAFWRFLVQSVLPILIHLRFPKKVLFARFIRALYIADYLVANYRSGRIDDNSVLYSYWLDEATAGFYLAERIEPRLHKCLKVSRAHRWDIIEPTERLPFRKRAFSALDKVIVASEFGWHELLELYPELTPICEWQHLGVAEVCAARTGKVVEGRREFISCSTVVPVKRVKLIYENICAYAQSHPHLQVHWIHFGDGTLMEELRQAVKTPPFNLQVELPGMQPNATVRNYLATIEGAILVHLSLHEATPIAIQEAISASIPVLATDGGGIREAIDNTVGALLPLEVEETDFIAQADRIWSEYSLYAQAARRRFEADFQSAVNFAKFYTLLRQWRAEKLAAAVEK